MGYSASYIDTENIQGLRIQTDGGNAFIDTFCKMLEKNGINLRKHSYEGIRQNVNVLVCEKNGEKFNIYFTGSAATFWNFSTNVIKELKKTKLTSYLVVMDDKNKNIYYIDVLEFKDAELNAEGRILLQAGFNENSDKKWLKSAYGGAVNAKNK